MALFVLSAATPLTVFTGIIPTGFAQTGLIGIPAAFVVVGVVVSLFFAGFTRMAPQIGNPGSFVGYIAHGLGRIAGVGGAAVALTAYSILLWGLFGFVGTAAAPLGQKWFGWDLPWWAYALGAWALVGWLGHRRVRDAGRVVGVLLGLEVAAIAVCSVTNLLNPAGGTVTTATLSPTNLFTPGYGAVLALAVIGFIGIESVVVFAKECDRPQRTVPLAAYVTIGITTVLYAGCSWALSVAAGPDGIVGAAQAHGPELVFHLARPYLGDAAIDVLHLLLLTSVLAAMVSFHNCGARYLLSLGKEHVLPRVLGRTSPKTGAPVAGSWVQSAATLLVIAVYAVLGLDPVRFLFYWAGASGAVGVLLLMTATAWSIVLYFVRAADRTAIRWWAIAILAAIGVSWVLVEALTHFALLLGEAPGPQPTRIILAVFGGVAAIGVTWAVWLRLTRHQDYLAIGLGGTREIDVDQGEDGDHQQGEAAPTSSTGR
ncbi:APC family permease [Lentzea terrae]|uniref:APC family permease n=1 Tax=Lentzea terrae TaxID=2200761 RepID=UPI001E3523E5|nr:APC family permease [Lentzea terrae]